MHDFVRGWKRANFWVMETQPGTVNWAPVNNALDRGETRAMAWQAVGHGADAVLYWQWRSALNGQEQYHGALVGPDGEPLPIYPEIAQTGAEFERAAQALKGTSPVAQVALLHSYDSRWAIDFQPFNRNYDQLEVLLGYYAPLREDRLTVDIVKPEAPLDPYKVVFAPSLNVISADLAAHLLAYVEQGGHLVLGPRSGMKDEHDALNAQRQPGPLVSALGGRVEQYYALETPVPVSGEAGEGMAQVWAEQLSAHDAAEQILLRYGKGIGWLEGQPAMISHRVGNGSIAYLGAVLDTSAMRAAMEWMLHDAVVEPEFTALPTDVEVCRRVGQGRTIYVLLNHGATSTEIKLPRDLRDVLSNDVSVSKVTLETQGVAVLEDDSPSSATGTGDKQ
jgi:beta-galactosidase